jgi:hypothetical protein
MAYLDTADCLQRVKDALNRPSTDAAFTVTVTDDVHYRHLTAAETRAVLDLAPRIPNAMYGAPAAMTTSDSGATYVVAATTFPIGHVRVYPTRSSIPDSPLIEGEDYLYEGDVIRMLPVGQTRTFSDSGPYAQSTKISAGISSGVEPTLMTPARMLIVYDACIRGAKRLNQDPAPFEIDYAMELGRVCLAFKTARSSLASNTRRFTRSGGVVR